MEIYVSTHVDGRATLALDDVGSAEGCFASRAAEHVSRSGYASPRGVAEAADERRRTLIGARGRWTHDEEGWLVIRFDRTARGECPPPKNVPSGDSAGALRLRCVRVEKNERVPSGLLACAPDDREPPWLADLLLDVGSPPRPRWLLLGAPPGVSVRGDVTIRAAPAPTLEIRDQRVFLDPEEWRGDVGGR